MLGGGLRPASGRYVVLGLGGSHRGVRVTQDAYWMPGQPEAACVRPPSLTDQAGPGDTEAQLTGSSNERRRGAHLGGRKFTHSPKLRAPEGNENRRTLADSAA